ncbi:MAG: phosphoribosylglycinamide formyltransferase [Phycisphaerales bacterium]|nr:phosphoribosylglycinamide formyltransferase [Phycisphaerales bacterium]MCB9854784.1 phosphoribosylglycinamide formyltransferase [Phycisphaerales bacterium]MCB9863744.1 phosphoribosylglycinamide formyltransferase [Phycisphaerales bacterium]
MAKNRSVSKRERRAKAKAERGGKSRDRLRIAVLISGSGSTLQNLIDRIADGRLPNTEIAIVISSRSDVEGVARAERAQLPCEIIRVKDHPQVEKFSDQISLTLDIYAVNLVVQAGWMCYWLLPNRWLNKTINVHPSLLPKYGGKGCYGNRVHEAVLAAGDRETGATVHWVNNEYDAGKIIEQQTCEVKPDDTVDTLAQRVQAIERELLPDVINKIRNREIKY